MDELQLRHPLLSASISSNDLPCPHFRRVPGRPIPLRVVETTEIAWEREVEKELHLQFDPEEAPLMRTVLLHQEFKDILILVTHHAIADGFSLAFAVRDLLRVLSGQPLIPLPLKPSREELIGLPPLAPDVQRGRSQLKPERNVSLDDQDASVPHIQRLRLSPGFTAILQSRAKMEGTTVHGALGAALAIAGRQIDRNWRENTLQILSPANIRELLRLEDEYMLALGGGRTSLDPQTTPEFWELARWMKSTLSRIRSRDAVAERMLDANRAVAAGMDVQTAAEFRGRAFGDQAMLTNLGPIPFGTIFGPLELESLWGPAALRGVDGEQTLGCLTLGGSLHLLHSSNTPIPALLSTIEEVLVQACRSHESPASLQAEEQARNDS